ncbi:hypothetical protein BDB00DRAFT_269264 [Zychaea mexicana]|uniref:uncharacterized protein n=1 Tax=Zychaea mexicana TaxID=64656 RepID=UPI0022FF1A6B|nr:uncharacterized protein BDB00DRAFT_269264 [Zychaea mexicana]KAI9495071.1 hypothetical protein BDB00DRAFT_269264 [Zychaea mexicana]
MSSLVETSNKEELPPVPGVQNIPGINVAKERLIDTTNTEKDPADFFSLLSIHCVSLFLSVFNLNCCNTTFFLTTGTHKKKGHDSNTQSLSQRIWNGFGLMTYMHRKVESTSNPNSTSNNSSSSSSSNSKTDTVSIRHQKDTITQNREDLQEELISMLTASEEALEDKDTITKIDNLIALMKAHKLSDDQIPPPPPPTSSNANNAVTNAATAIAAASSSSCSSSSSSSSSSSFDFNFDNKSGYAVDGPLQIPLDSSAAIGAKPSTGAGTTSTSDNSSKPSVIPMTDFHFSFTTSLSSTTSPSSSSSSSTRTRTYSRRHSSRNGLRRSSGNQALYTQQQEPHPLSQATTYPDATSSSSLRRGGDVDDDDDDYESDIDVIEAQILRAASPSKQMHLLNRKILPLPKPRWIRKAGMQQQQPQQQEKAPSSSEAVTAQTSQTSPPTSLATVAADTSTAATGASTKYTETPIPSSPSSSSAAATVTPYMWPFSPPILESSSRNYASTAFSLGGLGGTGDCDSAFVSTNLKEILLEHEIHNVGDPVDASYRENTKKIKRCGNRFTLTNDSEERIKGGLRRKDRRWKSNAVEDRKGKSEPPPPPPAHPAPPSSSSSPSGPQFPASSFDFTMGAQTRENLKQLPKLEDLPRSSVGPSLGLSNVLHRTLSQKVDRMEALVNRASLAKSSPQQQPPSHLNNNKHAATPITSTRPSPPPPPPPLPAPLSNADKKKTSIKESNRQRTKNDKVSNKSKSTASSKRGKKSQKKKKASTTTARTTTSAAAAAAAENEQGSGTNSNNNSRIYNKNTSDAAIVRSTDPDEWICVFCQYEIFSHGLETARRKGGYYRRKRERQRRLREMEARRAGECISGPPSDVDEGGIMDDPLQQHIVPPPVTTSATASSSNSSSNNGSGLTSAATSNSGPPLGLVDHRRRGREDHRAA